MRKREARRDISVQAIAGTFVVLLGMSVSKARSRGLLGFAIERTDHTEGERDFLRNELLFERNDVGDDADPSTEVNPVQAFVWGDYTAKPRHTYSYTVTAMYGTPAKLRRGPSATVRIRTEDPDDGDHGVFFNRGVAASAAYERRFGSRRPSDVPNGEAYTWLSRGLEEAVLRFIGRAVDDSYSLRAAIYEFEWEPVVEAFRVAHDAGADVRVVFDAVKGRTTARQNRAAIRAARLTRWTRPRTRINISHNKFIVLLHDGVPEEVWTGSTNITEGGIFGHANVGHRIRDRDVAERYLEYWNHLAKDPERKAFKAFNDPTPTFPAARPRKGSMTAIFSPRSKLDSLDWYVRVADSAKQAVFLTAAFGLTAEIAPVFKGKRDYLRYLLIDTEKGEVEATRREPSNVVAAGAYRGKGAFRTWIASALQYLNSVDFVHTKLMLIDPLTDDPIVVTGSANWSDESSKANDENVVVIRGNTRVADIYLTDFMRIFNHYRLRGRARVPASKREPGRRAKLHLAEDDSWAQPFFVEGSPESKERLLFA